MLAASPVAADKVVVLVAASLKTALDAVAADVRDATGHDMTISYAASDAPGRS
jgi:molybdate transport system substrate-binding protein